MCGIAGIYIADGDVREMPLDTIRDSLAHRGPDDYGTWIGQNNAIALMHRRLSVIDTSQMGHQPMKDSVTSSVIVFNGEIYNFIELKKQLISKGHRFKSESDTEVVLASYAEWGSKCVDHLVGMFAFCIYHKSKNILFLARDHVGEKPLYFYHSDNVFVFGSEIKALLQCPFIESKVSPYGLHSYLAYGYSFSGNSLFENIDKLPPAHFLEYSLTTRKVKLKRYWELPKYNPMLGLDKEQIIEQTESLLLDSVERQLVSDVPVGVLLSGGIDSSVITALAAKKLGNHIKTFTISFAGHGRFDDGPYAKLVSDYFKTEHTEIVAENISVDDLPTIVGQFDEPIADHAIIPFYILSKKIREHVTVALGGDGGDELFGGYPQYTYILQQQKLRKYIPSTFRSGLALMGNWLPSGFRGRQHILGTAGRIENAIAHVNMYFDSKTRASYLHPDLANEIGNSMPEQEKVHWAKMGNDPREKMMLSDFHTTLANGYLPKIDRSSMANSLEVRSPWLDKNLMEFASSSIPFELKATRLEKKIIPRAIGKKILPPTLDLNRKQGLTMPLNNWFKEDWGAFSREVLTDPSSEILDRKYIDKLFSLQERGFNNSNRLMSLTFLELWRKNYNVKFYF